MSRGLGDVYKRQILESKGVKHQVEEERHIILASWKMPSVIGDGLNVVFDLQEDGEFLMISALHVLECTTDHPNLGAVLQVMAESTWKTKMMRWEYDSSDGEVRASVHIPIEDSELTPAQLNRALGCLLQMCGRYLPILSHAKETGEVDMGLDVGGTTSIHGLVEQFRHLVEALQAQTGTASDDDLPDGLPATELDDFLRGSSFGGDRGPGGEG